MEQCIVTEGKELEPHVPTWARGWHTNFRKVKAECTVQMFVSMILSFWNIMELYILSTGRVHGGKSGGHKHLYTEVSLLFLSQRKCEHKVQNSHENTYNWKHFWTDLKKIFKVFDNLRYLKTGWVFSLQTAKQSSLFARLTQSQC